MQFSSERQFKVWDYNISLKQLLIRSPSTPEITGNIDVVFWQVEYLAIPTQMNGIAVDLPFDSEREAVKTAQGESSAHLYCIVSSGRRHLLSAGGFKVLKNEVDVFESTLVYFGVDRPTDWYGTVLAHS